ncbi:MAG: DUF2202 domain-containing protein [Proteobacteria bacterium]|nr:DUF2202 domain-containing protein [Pseudomonadota bacterium]MBU1738550.1 DUF2202 domain-containing protein [Pseudomonadota bacterium]
MIKKSIISLVVSLLILPAVYIPALAAPSSQLDGGETSHLIFMREEEKLARDVYITLGALYPDVATFSNIVSSEENHTASMRDKLAQYNIPDPSTDDTVGVFTGAEYGWYFLEKFTELVDWGKTNLLEALYVGAFIEELDLNDIVNCPDVIVDTDNGIDLGECGLLYTDNKSLIRSYNNLLDGSKSHLRAYVRNIESIIGAGNYEAQYLTQEEVDEILGR